MARYENNGKTYKVESTSYAGACIQVNGTTITDQQLMSGLLGLRYKTGGYTVFVDSDELGFDTFEEAYDFAMTKQKDTFRI